MALFVRRQGLLPRLAACAMWLHAAIVLTMWLPRLAVSATRPQGTPAFGFNGDTTGAFFVLVTTLVALASLTHACGFFGREAQAGRAPSSRSIGQFYFFAALFVLAMYVVVLADNLGYMWIGMEATTLLSASLVYFHRSRHSLEATWKYVIICSVGIAFGFFGTALLFTASQHSGVLGDGSLSILALNAHAGRACAHELRIPPSRLRHKSRALSAAQLAAGRA
jgi:hydrogenase-4 component F